MGKRRRTSSSSSDSSSSDSSDQDSRAKLKRQVDSTSSSEDDDWNETANTNKKKLKKTTAKVTSKKQTKASIKESEDDDSPIDDEKEEGEVDDDDDEFNDGYDENLMGDEEDQKRLLLMTEKEREQELFNRSEKREVLKTRFEIEKKLRLAKKKEQNKITFTDATLRSTDRRKTLENNRKQKDGLKQLKEQREKRKQKAKLRASDVYSSSDDDSDNERNQRRKSSSSSSASSSDESSGDERRRKSDDEFKQEHEEPYELDVKRLNTIRLSRHKLSRWCHSPFFKETVIGCFVRLSVGARENVPVYRIAEIVDVCDGLTAYELEDTKTAKTLKLKYGRDENNFKIKFTSNTEFTDREFVDWKSKMERDRVSLPSKKHIDDKIKSITAAMNYNFKDSDVDAIVKEKEKYAQQPINFAMKKTQLKKDKDMAEQRGDHKRVEEITQQLENLEQQARDLDYKRTQRISAISYINERNRHSNIIEAEKAIVLAREQDKLNQGDDPFRRRKCAPMLVNVTKNKQNVIKVEDGKDTVDAAKAPTAAPAAVQNGKSQSVKTKDDKQAEIEQNDLFEAHDFEIQIDFDITSNLTSASNNSLSSSLYSSNQSNLLSSANKSANRRSLNLEEYKKKKGLI